MTSGLADQRSADLARRRAFRGGLEEDAPDAHRRPKPARIMSAATSSDAIGSARSKPGRQDHDAGDGGPDERVQVGEQVLVGALDVEALAVRLRERPGRNEVDHDADERDDQHRPAADIGRVDRRGYASYTISARAPAASTPFAWAERTSPAEDRTS